MDFAQGTPEHRRHYAAFADAAYTGPAKAQLPEGYMLDIAYSNRNQILGVNHSTKHAVLAFRGTDLSNVSNAVPDLANDALLAMGVQSIGSRFRSGVRAAKAVKTAYPEYKLTLTGHSLGASSGAFVHSKVKDTDFVGYSTHVPVREATQNIAWSAIDTLLKKPRKKGSVNYITSMDPISWTAATSYDKHTYVVPQTQRSPHSLKNFMA